MKFLKLLSKLGLKSKFKVKQTEPQEALTIQKDVKPKTKYPVSTFELIKKHGNEPEAQNIIIKRLRDMDEVARGYALDSLMDSFGEDPKTAKLLDKYLKQLTGEDKVWALRDFAFHHGDIEQVRSLIGKFIPEMAESDKYYLLTDLTVHHGESIDVQKLIVKHINDLSNQHKYDILYCLSHLHGLNQDVQNLILTNLKDLTEAQIKEIFSGLVPKVAKDLVGKHIDSLSEKNRSTLIKNTYKDKEEPVEKKKEKKPVKQEADKLEKTEIVLLDLSNIKKVKNSLGEETLEVNFQNPVKIYPYVYEKNEDTQIGDAFLTVKDNKVYATITLCPQLRETVKSMPNRKPIYKPSGNLSIYKGEAKHMMVDFIYMVF